MLLLMYEITQIKVKVIVQIEKAIIRVGHVELYEMGHERIAFAPVRVQIQTEGTRGRFRRGAGGGRARIHVYILEKETGGRQSHRRGRNSAWRQNKRWRVELPLFQLRERVRMSIMVVTTGREQIRSQESLLGGGRPETGQGLGPQRVVLLLIQIEVVVVRWRHVEAFAQREYVKRLGLEQRHLEVHVQVGPGRAEARRIDVRVVGARAALLIVLRLRLND